MGDREKTHRRLENAGETTEPVVKQFSDRPPSERLRLMKFKRKLRVVAIQPFGYNREEFIKGNVEGVKGIDYEYEYHSGDFSYNKHIECEISEGFELDTVYESKAYLQMRLQGIVNPKKENVCFWVIGNANNLR